MQLSHDWCLLVFAQRAPGLSLTIQYFICYFNSVALLITFTWFYIPLVYIPQLLKALIPLHPGNPAAGYSQLWAVSFSNVVDFEYKICSKGNKSKSVGLHFIIINSLHKECSAFFISLFNSLNSCAFGSRRRFYFEFLLALTGILISSEMKIPLRGHCNYFGFDFIIQSKSALIERNL